MSLKNIKAGDTVIVKGFTGIKLGVFEVAKATDKNITVNKKDGSKMIFSRSSGKQLNVEEGKEKYANSIMEDDGSYVKPDTSKKTETKATKKKDSKKKTTKKAEPVVEPEEELEEDYEDEDEFEDDDDFEDVE